jgi:UDP-N-acetylglucosamine acyltransferase
MIKIAESYGVLQLWIKIIMIHSTAIIGKNVKLESGVEVGPYSFIDGNVTIGKNTKIHSSVSITGNTTIGENNIIFPFCSIGSIPQDLKYYGEETYLKIGDSNTFREHCTVNMGTEGGGFNTIIGNWISLYDRSTYSS